MENICKPNIKDVKEIKELIDFYANKNLMLPRSYNTLYTNIRDYNIYKLNNKLVGVCNGQILWSDLAEIKSLAVHPEYTKRGIAKKLVNYTIDNMKQLGINRIFTLTYVPDFFKKLGFHLIDKNDLPHKIWNDCINCNKFPDCDEIALMLEA